MSSQPDPNNLDELMLRTGADIRSPLLRTLVDLYLQRPTHTAEEARHFTELVLRLLEQADAETRIAMARRLASYPSVPAAIMRRLAIDVPEIPALIQPARMAGRRPDRRQAPKSQDPISPDELSDLFFAASPPERRLILINLTYAPQPAATVHGDQAGEAARQLEMAALGHNTKAVVRTLERWLGIAPALARRIISDPLGEPIIVVAKVLGIAPDALQRVLLFVNPAVGRSVSRVYELAALFNTIDIQAAHVLVGIWRAARPQPAMGTAPALPSVSERSPRRGAPARTTGPQQRFHSNPQAGALTRAKR